MFNVVGEGGRTRHALSFCMTKFKVVLLLFSMGEGYFVLSMLSEEYPPCKDCE